jgi:hypothetical protein
MKAFGVLQGANEMNRQAQADEEKKLQRADTLRAIQDVMGSQNNESQALINVLTKMQGIQQMPQNQTSFAPNNQTGTATDLETGQSYSPTETPNVSRMEESKKAWAEMQNIVHPAEAVLQLDKYPYANPETLLTLWANKNNVRKEMVKSLFDMHQEELREQRKSEHDMAKIDKEYAYKKEIAGMEKKGKEMNPQLVGHTKGGKGMPAGLPVSYKEGQQYVLVNGQEIPYNGPIIPKVDNPIFPPPQPLFVNLGVDPTTGNPINLNARTGGTVVGDAPPGGIAPKVLPQVYKDKVTALNQTEDLVNRLQDNWEKLGIGGKTDVMAKSVAGSVGAYPDFKVYADQSEAFLGNLSRSLAAERGVLTDQDITRIRGAIAKVGMNPMSIDTGAEGKKKWAEIRGILNDARKRVEQESKMTQINPSGSAGAVSSAPKQSGKKQLADPLGIR